MFRLDESNLPQLVGKPRGCQGRRAVDWSCQQARSALPAGTVADPDRLPELTRQAPVELEEDNAEGQRIGAAADPLGQLLLQDVERTDDGVSFGASLRVVVSRERMTSVHDVGA